MEAEPAEYMNHQIPNKAMEQTGLHPQRDAINAALDSTAAQSYRPLFVPTSRTDRLS